MRFTHFSSEFIFFPRGLGTARHQGETGQAAGKDHACLSFPFPLFFAYFFITFVF